MEIQVPIQLDDRFVEAVASAVISSVENRIEVLAKVRELPPYSTRTQLKKVLEISEDTLNRWEVEGLKRINWTDSRVRYDRDDIKVFLNTKKI